jgi:hypothetical protein
VVVASPTPPGPSAGTDHAGRRDDVAEVGDLPAAKRALRLLDEEVLLLQGGEDSTDVEQMFRLAGVVDEDVVEED